MVEKTRGKCFDCYFYKSSVWDDIFAKHVVWAAKNAIFSKMSQEACFTVRITIFAISWLPGHMQLHTTYVYAHRPN
jgi:hypothetical protein